MWTASGFTKANNHKILEISSGLSDNATMSNKTPLVTCLAISFGLMSLSPLKAEGNTGLQALQAIPEEFADSIVKVSATECSPDPSYWLVLAYQDEIGDGPKEFKVVSGEVEDDHASFKVGQLISHSTAIDRSKVNVDSPVVFAIAQAQMEAGGGNMTKANMSLTQDGEGGSPVWSVDCFGSGGERVGSLRLSADTGVIFSREVKPGGQ